MRTRSLFPSEYPMVDVTTLPILRKVPRCFAGHPHDLHPDRTARFKALADTDPEVREWAVTSWGYGTEDDYFKDFDLDKITSVVSDWLPRAFSFEEMLHLWFAGGLGGGPTADFDEWFCHNHFILWKVRNSLYRSSSRDNYNDLVRGVNGLRRLRVDLPDFELKLVHTPAFQMWSFAAQEGGPKDDGQTGVYLDSPFGLLLYYKGAHVLTVGFTISARGVYVTQVQLRRKKGNRFLYKLPKHYMDVALDILHNAFGDTLWLAEGQSAVKAVRTSYGKAPCKMTPEDETRMAAFYNRPLADFDRARTRGRQPQGHLGQVYVRLRRRKLQAVAA